MAIAVQLKPIHADITLPQTLTEEADYRLERLLSPLAVEVYKAYFWYANNPRMPQPTFSGLVETLADGCRYQFRKAEEELENLCLIEVRKRCKTGRIRVRNVEEAITERYSKGSSKVAQRRDSERFLECHRELRSSYGSEKNLICTDLKVEEKTMDLPTLTEKLNEQIKGSAKGPSKRAIKLSKEKTTRAGTGVSHKLWNYYVALYKFTYNDIMPSDSVKKTHGMFANLLSHPYSEAEIVAFIDCMFECCTDNSYFVFRNGLSIKKMIGVLDKMIAEHSEWIQERTKIVLANMVHEPVE